MPDKEKSSILEILKMMDQDLANHKNYNFHHKKKKKNSVPGLHKEAAYKFNKLIEAQDKYYHTASAAKKPPVEEEIVDLSPENVAFIQACLTAIMERSGKYHGIWDDIFAVLKPMGFGSIRPIDEYEKISKVLFD